MNSLKTFIQVPVQKHVFLQPQSLQSFAITFKVQTCFLHTYTACAELTSIRKTLHN